MPATTEHLLEEIKRTERALETDKAEGNQPGVESLTKQLSELRQRLAKANEALTEGRQILKD